jgi:hypothetical protein
MHWRCSIGHEWYAVLASIKNAGSWCPRCPLKNESECLRLFEALLGKDFPKQRPDWLQGLELDGYNEELQLAFEYNGEQHYQVVKRWHPKGEESLREQQERDKRKEDLCTEHEVTLIVIPYTVKNKRDFIWRELTRLGYDLVPEEDYALADSDDTDEDSVPDTEPPFPAPTSATAGELPGLSSHVESVAAPRLTDEEVDALLADVLEGSAPVQPPQAEARVTDGEMDALMAEIDKIV